MSFHCVAELIGNLIRHVIGHWTGEQRCGGLRSHLPLITGSGLRLLAAEALRNLPLLRLAQIEFLLLHVARRALRGSEADAAENRKDECARAK